eukprot:m.8084 g.8084  ORF g.8084 m.8084 type:complete len:146 (-) comp3838_c0_seq1:179-616(-)
MASLVNSDTSVRVSSTLNRDVKQFNKKFMFDGLDETCWNSDQGEPQFVHLDFGKKVIPEQLQIMFQGGFVGKECLILGTGAEGGELVKLMDFYPEDINTMQSFDIKLPEGLENVNQLRIVFANSTDFYGRITIYSLSVLGCESDA